MGGEEKRHQMMQNLFGDQSEEEEELDSEHESNPQPYASVKLLSFPRFPFSFIALTQVYSFPPQYTLAVIKSLRLTLTLELDVIVEKGACFNFCLNIYIFFIPNYKITFEFQFIPKYKIIF